jgi:hypothetical protein
MRKFCFVYGLFKDAAGSSDYMASNGKLIKDGKSEEIWKGFIVAYLKVLPWHCPGKTEENHERPQSGYLV